MCVCVFCVSTYRLMSLRTDSVFTYRLMSLLVCREKDGLVDISYFQAGRVGVFAIICIYACMSVYTNTHVHAEKGSEHGVSWLFFRGSSDVV
jgi:hypothetical protein